VATSGEIKAGPWFEPVPPPEVPGMLLVCTVPGCHAWRWDGHVDTGPVKAAADGWVLDGPVCPPHARTAAA
jgi:hypothetical protein